MGEGGAGEGQGAAVDEATGFEVGIVVPKLYRGAAAGCGEVENCVARLVRELEDVGLIVERVRGVPAEFIKLSAPMGTLGRVAAEMNMKKLTYIGMELQFEWDQVGAFVRQPDGSLFSWRERFACFRHLIYSIVNKTDSDITLSFDDKEFHWTQNESLLTRLEDEGIVKLVFPLHDEIKRKQLLRSWALKWFDFTWQPIDEIYSYFGTKIAIYFSFLGMYTRWLFFPAVFGLATQLIDFGSLQWLVLPAFFFFVISWAVFFLQFWKRKNSAVLARWGINYSFSEYKTMGNELDPLSFSMADDNVQQRKFGAPKEKSIVQRNEWFGVLLRIRNNAIIVLAIICLQLPFELAYAHLYAITKTEALRYVLTAVYLAAIQYYTRIGGKVSVTLIKYENNQGEQSSADSLVYKVFGLYFMQSYIGLFYHASLHRNIMALRQVLIKRLIVSQVLENLIENSIPYLNYSYKKYRAVHKKKHEKESPAGKSVRLSTRVEKEYLKPSYTASIGEELEDGLFDDFLELTLQFGMIMMFACAFPLIFCFAALNNVTEIRADALKLLVMLKRPAPRDAATIGAWLNIFQFLVVMAICTNCLLLVCLYDEEGKWKIEPGLAAILIMEHALFLIKFGFSHFVPEEPAWVKANRGRYVAQAQNVCSKELLRSIAKLDAKLE
ncbi:anoctamin-like protein Os01g0706700 [Oryza glaberrima]|uniref:Anoctamin transmembrane domain-containing protein n=1 Tax=Oryza glaberrima TaxID=4538 RepID=I1NR40_ORYGL|nr:anoctamin-like protein Os01g0706700 [Oryza glaberrima]